MLAGGQKGKIYSTMIVVYIQETKNKRCT